MIQRLIQLGLLTVIMLIIGVYLVLLGFLNSLIKTFYLTKGVVLVMGCLMLITSFVIFGYLIVLIIEYQAEWKNQLKQQHLKEETIYP